jgi:hypothetical protein|tara:strand:+ start:1111 stop:1227 length:117 start_codon:yes stop_codon:yes gene_type:complete
MSDEKEKYSEGLILFAMIGITLGGTLILNWIVSLFIQL